MPRSRRDVPNDPDRKTRILDATLEVIAEHGVYRTTHRRIAARAQVPLGSVTYHFTNLDDVLARSFARLVDHMSAQYRERMENAFSRAEAEAAVVDLICGPTYAPKEQVVLLFEMYAYAHHNGAVADLTRSWLYTSRESLAPHFSPDMAKALDVLIEGWPMHATFERTPPEREVVAAAVHAISAAMETREAEANDPKGTNDPKGMNSPS